jgi:subtilisin family serine protease
MTLNDSAQRIVLRGRKTFFRSRSAGPLAGPSMEMLLNLVEPVLEQSEMTPREVADLQRDPDVVAIADPMPLKLIEPMDASDQDVSASLEGGNTWGIEAVGAHTSPFSGEGVTVAVLDTGINPGHVAFAGVDLQRHNFTQGAEDDENGHGTHCAGTIFGRDVDGRRIGVARGVQKALIGKVLGPGGGSSASLANAINWAYANGANVISMSLGIDFPGFVDSLVNQHALPIPAATSIALEQYRANVNLFSSLTSLLEHSGAFSQACVIVAASGNESDRPNYEVAVAPPAAGDGIISVGALQRDPSGALSVASFSNTQCNLSGPGVAVTSAWISGPKALRTISGTSMATPHVAGCAALWAEQLRRTTGVLTNENLAAKVLATAKFITAADFADIGNGMVQAPQ